MFRPLHLILALALALAPLTAGPAVAETLRYPELSTPAFTCEKPDGWTFEKQGLGFILSSPDTLAFVLVSVIEDPQLGEVSDDQMANMSMKAARAKPFTRSEATTFGEAPATIYFS